MRKLTYIAALLVALVATGYAVADGMEGAKSVSAVAGTFTATGTSTSSRTCTTTDGKTIVVTDGKYTGTATGDPDLTGRDHPARPQRDQHDRQRRRRQRLAEDRPVVGSRHRRGVLGGLRPRHDRRPGDRTGAWPVRRLVANLSATFSAASGFTGGKLGGGTSGGSAVEVGGSSCKSSHPTPEKSEAHGTISALSATSITVAGLTCAIPSDKSADVNAKFKQNDVAQIRCSLVSGVNTLTDISGKNHH